MTERLPPSAIFKDVIVPLQTARDAAMLVASLQTDSYPVTATRELCVKRLKEAAAVFGYELVERLDGKGMREP
jgi:hypothetical protein